MPERECVSVPRTIQGSVLLQKIAVSDSRLQKHEDTAMSKYEALIKRLQEDSRLASMRDGGSGGVEGGRSGIEGGGNSDGVGEAAVIED